MNNSAAIRSSRSSRSERDWPPRSTPKRSHWTSSANRSASPRRADLLTVRASWGDAQTSYLLVDATINGYLDLLAETVAIDSVEAIDFWTGIRAEAQTRSDTAEDELRGYTATLPELDPGERLSTAQELDLTRLNATLDAALADVRDAQDRIDTAKLNVEASPRVRQVARCGWSIRHDQPTQRRLRPSRRSRRRSCSR